VTKKTHRATSSDWGRLSLDLIPAHADNHHRLTILSIYQGHSRLRGATLQRRITMYDAIVATFAALTVFVPTFIGLRARTNADWRDQ